MSRRLFTLEEIKEAIEKIRVPWRELPEMIRMAEIKNQILLHLHQIADREPLTSVLTYKKGEGFSLAEDKKFIIISPWFRNDVFLNE